MKRKSIKKGMIGYIREDSEWKITSRSGDKSVAGKRIKVVGKNKEFDMIGFHIWENKKWKKNKNEFSKKFWIDRDQIRFKQDPNKIEIQRDKKYLIKTKTWEEMKNQYPMDTDGNLKVGKVYFTQKMRLEGWAGKKFVACGYHKTGEFKAFWKEGWIFTPEMLKWVIELDDNYKEE